MFKVIPVEDRADEVLRCFFELEDLPSSASTLTADEARAVDHFNSTVQWSPDGCYSVCLPRKQPTPKLGESESVAIKRFSSNHRSLKRKGTWEVFNTAVHEYLELDHAEVIPHEQLEAPDMGIYYLPMHGVAKDSSTTTKLRVVFDASAKTSSTFSLNDTLLACIPN